MGQQDPRKSGLVLLFFLYCLFTLVFLTSQSFGRDLTAAPAMHWQKSKGISLASHQNIPIKDRTIAVNDFEYTLTSPWVAFYSSLNSVDFDLNLAINSEMAGLSTDASLSCQVYFFNFDPPQASISNPDGIDAQGNPYIVFGLYPPKTPRTGKSRRGELSTQGFSSVTFNFDVSCRPASWPSAYPLINTLTPFHGSVGDSIVIHGFSLLGNTLAPFDARSAPPLYITIGGVRADIESMGDKQIEITLPENTQTGPLVFHLPFSPFARPPRIGHFRVTSILAETYSDDTANGPQTGLLFTALYPQGSINGDGCPTTEPVYSLFTNDFDITSGQAFEESERLPEGTFDALAWIDADVAFTPRPLAGNRRVENFANTVTIMEGQRSSIAHHFTDSYSQDCPIP